MSPLPKPLRLIAEAKTDILSRRLWLETEAKKRGLRVIFNTDIFSKSYGKALGVEALP